MSAVLLRVAWVLAAALLTACAYDLGYLHGHARGAAYAESNRQLAREASDLACACLSSIGRAVGAPPPRCADATEH